MTWYFLNIRDEESAAAFLREKGSVQEKERGLKWYFLNIRDEESAAAFLREKGSVQEKERGLKVPAAA
ncbi:hypothetical protein M514_24518 [Trichuris suis]|uniref:Uncharacterized protein n=1 Tax=Trichuris suis TaxID=68888 RepID=A0A085N1J2_9BILA|nr:hypothetical protein M514_24518 [Trichuris suis]